MYLTQLDGTPKNRAAAEADAVNIRFVQVEVPAQSTTVFLAKVVPAFRAP